MTDRQENKLSMALAVKAILLNFNGVVKDVTAFAKAAIDLDNVIASIQGHARVQAINTTGIRIDKDAAAETAIDLCLGLTGPTKSYAIDHNNNELFAEVNYSKWDLMRIRDAELTSKLYGIRDIIQDTGAALADYGITAEAVNGFSESIGFYDGLVVAPREAITERRNATEAMIVDFDMLDIVLLRLDGFAELKKASEADFFRTYQAAREVVDHHGPGKKQPEEPVVTNPVI